MSLFEKLELRTVKTTTEGFGSCSREWKNYTSNVNILTSICLWFTASPSHPCQDHLVACDSLPHQSKGNTWRHLRPRRGSTCSGSAWLAFIVKLNIHFGFPRMSVARRAGKSSGNWQPLKRQTSRRRDGREPNKLMAPVARAGRTHKWLFEADDRQFFFFGCWRKRNWAIQI